MTTLKQLTLISHSKLLKKFSTKNSVNKELNNDEASVTENPIVRKHHRSEYGGILVYDCYAKMNREDTGSAQEIRIEETHSKELSAYDKHELQKGITSDLKSYYKMRNYGSVPVYIAQHHLGTLMDKSSLTFESRFDSGNLWKAIKTSGCEYTLFLNSDTGTFGNHLWYYFSVANQDEMKVTFRIVNIHKLDTLYTIGMQPAVYSKTKEAKEQVKWHRDCQDITYEPNDSSAHNTLVFTYTFKYPDDTVYFAYTIPYTYKELAEYTENIKKKHRDIARVNCLCKTIGGNTCELITITENISSFLSFEDEVHEWDLRATARKLARQREAKPPNPRNKPDPHSHKKGIVLTARVHSGETVSSHTMKGTIDFLLGDSREAKALRAHFVFKIVPMLNPDGVRYGNSRCSLIGVDLNRRWQSTNRLLHPTVFYTKKMLGILHERHEVILFVDYHGHSKKRNVFMYGCSAKDSDKQKNLTMKFVPVMLTAKNPFFSFRDCHFRMEIGKEGAARLAVFNQFGILNSYTLEATAYGPSNPKEGNAHMKETDFESVGRDLCQVCLNFASHKLYMQKIQFVSMFLTAELEKSDIEKHIGSQANALEHILPCKDPKVVKLQQSEVKSSLNLMNAPGSSLISRAKRLDFDSKKRSQKPPATRYSSSITELPMLTRINICSFDNRQKSTIEQPLLASRAEHRTFSCKNSSFKFLEPSASRENLSQGVSKSPLSKQRKMITNIHVQTIKRNQARKQEMSKIHLKRHVHFYDQRGTSQGNSEQFAMDEDGKERKRLFVSPAKVTNLHRESSLCQILWMGVQQEDSAQSQIK